MIQDHEKNAKKRPECKKIVRSRMKLDGAGTSWVFSSLLIKQTQKATIDIFTDVTSISFDLLKPKEIFA